MHRRRRRDWDRALISAITFSPCMKTICLVKLESCFWYEALALQHYNNKAPDSKLVTVPRLHGYTCRSMTVGIAVYLLIKLMQKDNNPRDTVCTRYHCPFRHSIPYSSPVVRDAPLCHYCEIVDYCCRQQDLQGFGGTLNGWMRVSIQCWCSLYCHSFSEHWSCGMDRVPEAWFLTSSLNSFSLSACGNLAQQELFVGVSQANRSAVRVLTVGGRVTKHTINNQSPSHKSCLPFVTIFKSLLHWFPDDQCAV